MPNRIKLEFQKLLGKNIIQYYINYERLIKAN